MKTLRVSYAKSAVEPSKEYVGTVEKETPTNITLELIEGGFRTFTKNKIINQEELTFEDRYYK